MKRHARVVLLTVVALGLAASVSAQQDPAFVQASGLFRAWSGGNIDKVDVSTGNLQIKIPLIAYPQRGGKLNLSFSLILHSGPAVDTNICDSNGANCYVDVGAFQHGSDLVQDGALDVVE